MMMTLETREPGIELGNILTARILGAPIGLFS
jgi:hypothetical protein